MMGVSTGMTAVHETRAQTGVACIPDRVPDNSHAITHLAYNHWRVKKPLSCDASGLRDKLQPNRLRDLSACSAQFHREFLQCGNTTLLGAAAPTLQVSSQLLA